MKKNLKGKIFNLKLFKKLMVFVKPYRFYYHLVLITAILLSVFSIVTPYLLKIIVDDYIRPKDYQGMKIIILFMLISLFLTVIFQILFVYFANFLGQKVINDLRVKLFKRILDFKLDYFKKNPIGRLVTRTVNDIETIASIFSQGLFLIIADLLQMFLVIIVMLYVNFELSLIVFSILPVVLYATKLFQKSMKKAFEEVRFQVANLNSYVQERISGMKIVQIFNRENEEYEKFKVINRFHRNAWLKTVWINSIFFPVAEISSSVLIGLIVWYGGYNIITDPTITIGMIFLFIQMSQMLFRPLRQIADKFNTLQMGMVSVERVFKILELDFKIIDNGKIILKSIKGLIFFKNVKFSYNKGEEVIKGISLKIEPGQKTAIVGPTGAGKSTIINLISRFYDIDSGKIHIDGFSIQNIELNSLRKNIGIVLQEVFLYADSIYNNITLFDSSIKKSEVINSAKEIGIHDFIMTLPNGYDFNIQERGQMLSSGQRQLIAFLRVYIRNPKLLILDEATSSVDSYSEEIIQNAINKLTKGKTSIIIAHRLDTIKNSDKIIVLDRGKIVEEGVYNDLLKSKNSYFKKFNIKKPLNLVKNL
ncbi:MAG: antibiotic ABC transporter ATP-binding protein [Flavobacteriaceae bacterium]|nr:antibiotic ABC transporter ATP-binding protein [Flavobacteriaceae bacterium]|tara:strand:- start:19568 stop:21340 length:1773 start_codon:yes stop_codon:yes gene_type:complete